MSTGSVVIQWKTVVVVQVYCKKTTHLLNTYRHSTEMAVIMKV